MGNPLLDTGLEGKTALITGANNPRGIGAAIARTLAKQGVTLFVTYVQGAPPPDDAEVPYYAYSAMDAGHLVTEIRDNGGRAEALEIDLSAPENIAPLFDRAEAFMGHVDILVNNAAHSTADTFAPANLINTESVAWLDSVPGIHAETIDRHFATNTRAVALMMAEYARRHAARAATWGRIVNISTDGAPAFPSEVSYGASKYALESYSRAAAIELGQFGITVNVVSPGPTQTGWMTPSLEAAIGENTPLRRVGQPEDIAEAVLFLVSRQGGWVTGQVLHVNGGHRI